ncbi:MAG: class I SAM-dependent methyltransferase [Anaerolineae bacterium]
MGKDDQVWQTAELTATFLTGVRSAIPLAQEQIAVMLRLIRAARPAVNLVLDLGCGDGILGQAVLDQHPEAQGVFLDFSPPMLDAARKRLAGYGRALIANVDYGQTDWRARLDEIVSGHFAVSDGFDVIVSGYSIHHQPDGRKREIYAELYDLLRPGGIFLNLEHVASRSPWVEQRFADLFIDALVDYHLRAGVPKTPEQVDREFYSRPDKAANKLALVETQCEWLREIGFLHVDVYLKIFELALFGGVR